MYVCHTNQMGSTINSPLTLFRLGFFGQSVTGGGSSDPPSVSLEPIMLGS